MFQRHYELKYAKNMSKTIFLFSINTNTIKETKQGKPTNFVIYKENTHTSEWKILKKFFSNFWIWIQMFRIFDMIKLKLNFSVGSIRNKFTNVISDHPIWWRDSVIHKCEQMEYIDEIKNHHRNTFMMAVILRCESETYDFIRFHNIK